MIHYLDNSWYFVKEYIPWNLPEMNYEQGFHLDQSLDISYLYLVVAGATTSIAVESEATEKVKVREVKDQRLKVNSAKHKQRSYAVVSSLKTSETQAQIKYT